MRKRLLIVLFAALLASTATAGRFIDFGFFRAVGEVVRTAFTVTDNGGEAFRVTDNGGEDFNVR